MAFLAPLAEGLLAGGAEAGAAEAGGLFGAEGGGALKQAGGLFGAGGGGKNRSAAQANATSWPQYDVTSAHKSWEQSEA